LWNQSSLTINELEGEIGRLRINLAEADTKSSIELKKLREHQTEAQVNLETEIVALKQTNISLDEMVDHLTPSKQAFEEAVQAVVDPAQSIIRIKRDLSNNPGQYNPVHIARRKILNHELSTVTRQQGSAATLLRTKAKLAGPMFESPVQSFLSSLDTTNQANSIRSNALALITTLDFAKPE
jgi:hypothetical protein